MTEAYKDNIIKNLRIHFIQILMGGFILFPLTPFAQNLQLHFTCYTKSNGLCNNSILGFFQDSKGFLWVRTSDGLSRYDGVTFENFRHIPKDTNSIGGNTVYSICELPGNLILIGTANGLSIFNNNRHCFENWRVTNPELKSGTQTIVTSIITDPFKNIWINFNGKLEVYDSLLRFKFSYTDTPQGKKLREIVCTQNGFAIVGDELWMQNKNHGIAVINTRTLSCSSYIDGEGEIFHNWPIRGIYEDKASHSIYYSPWGMGLYKYNLIKKTHTVFRFSAPKVMDETYRNTINHFIGFGEMLLMATTNGLVAFHKNKHTEQVFLPDPYDAFSLPGREISSLFLSSNNILWVGTDNGLARCDLNQKSFVAYSKEFRNNETDAPIEFNDFDIYNSEWLICGTIDAGIYAYNFRTGEKKHYANRSPKVECENEMSKIYVDKQNRIWVSTYYGLRIFNLESNKLSPPPNGLNDISTSLSITMFQDSHNDYWISYEGDSALVHVTRNAKGEYEKKYFRVAEDGFPIYKINHIREDRDQNILISTSWSLGFLKWVRKTNTFIRLPMVKSPAEYLSETYFDIWPDTGNMVWLATKSRGLIQYNANNNISKSFTKENGLISDNLVALYKHPDSTLWITTTNGLSSFDPNTKQVVNYNEDDGLPEVELLSKIKFDKGSKYIYVLTPHYIINFKPVPPGHVPVLSSQNFSYIRGLQVNGQNQFYNLEQMIDFKYDENNFNIEFSTLDLRFGAKTIFAYRLNGLDDNWIYCNDRRFVNYSNLTTGTYFFEVKTSNGGEKWTAPKTLLKFQIYPPFYLAWWFIIITIAVLLMAGYLFYSNRKRQRLELENVRARISRDLHDDIGSTLTSISIFSEIARQQDINSDQRDRYLLTIGTSSRQIIDNMNDIVWAVNPLNDRFENIIRRMRNHASESLEGTSATLHFEASVDLKNIVLGMVERKNFYLIYKEALNNAIKHSEADQLIVKISKAENLLLLQVMDNGKGLSTDSKANHKDATSGNGLRNMRTRAQEMKALLTVDSGTNGTIITLKMNLS